MQGYATSGCIRKALKTLNFMRNVPGKPTVYDYSALIHCNLKSEYVMLEELVEVYVGMKRFGLYPNASTFNTLLNGMISHRKTRDAFVIAQEMYLAYALSVFKYMLRFNYFPSEPTFNLLIVSLSKAGIMHEAYYVFSFALEKGYFRGAHSHNPILWALCKSGQSYTALALFYSFKKKGCGHNVCSYVALVYGFSRERLWKKAFRCLSEMQTVSYKPNVRTYTAVVKFLCVDGRIQEALSLLDKMEKEACDPDLITYNIVLHELHHQSKVAEIYELVSVIDQKGLYPDPFTHSALVGGLLRAGLCKENIEEALELFDCVEWDTNGPDLVSFNTVLSAACHQGNSPVVQKILDEMDYEVVNLNAVSSTGLIQYFDTVGKILECLKLLEFGSCDVEWSFSHYSNFQYTNEHPLQESVTRNGTPGNDQLLSLLLRNMYRQGLKPDAVTFGSLIYGLGKEGNITVAHKLWEQMTGNGITPNIAIYNTITEAMSDRGKFQDIIVLLKEMAMEGVNLMKFLLRF
ncbi:hypothetical protein RHSIM_Rhsim02G0187200 [Rhododendron simsii]|uniref:Pentatricopeptide repeat-containing protein n=1 Tax=Rhododendron simsii TaxID=118357 RepID=A0A834LU50_RHOSS|nr:hypothetical protein RHSIM_Rhsim02G0187200 [Rhododendron simsii]